MILVISSPLTLRQAIPGDWRAVQDLLLTADLPVDDLGPDKLSRFLIAEDDKVTVGLIGLEVLGTVGLLRSLVVARSARSTGLGGKLVGALESAAEAAGIAELWLLTIDAERFFQRHNFEIVDRTVAPDEIRQTGEFSTLCPDTAFLMRKTLAQERL
jgi:amino-acid N-acetyltransferase